MTTNYNNIENEKKKQKNNLNIPKKIIFPSFIQRFVSKEVYLADLV